MSKKVVQLIAATANLFVDSTLMYSVVFDDSTDVTTKQHSPFTGLTQGSDELEITVYSQREILITDINVMHCIDTSNVGKIIDETAKLNSVCCMINVNSNKRMCLILSCC